MSTATLPRPSGAASPQPLPHEPMSRPEPAQQKVTLWRVIASEWVKFLSLRSTVITLAATGILVVAFGALTSAMVSSDTSISEHGGSRLSMLSPADASLSGAQFALLLVGILGVIYATGEYSTGMIRTSFNAVPKRLPILFGKAVVLGILVFTTMLVACFAAFFVGQMFFGSDAAALGDEGVLGMIFGQAGYLMGASLIGLGIGILLRSTPAAIAAFVGSFMFLPLLLGLILPSSWSDNIVPYLPSEAGAAFTSTVANPDLLSSGSAIVVFALWVIGTITAAGYFLKQRDA